MMMRVGISRQQYQRLESKGNPRLDTLELVAKGLGSEIMLIPNEKLEKVLAVLNESSDLEGSLDAKAKVSIEDDPWQGLLEHGE